MYLLIFLCICKSLGQSPPDDFSMFCRQGSDNIDRRIFPENLELMLDSYDYTNLIEGVDAVWLERNLDSDTDEVLNFGMGGMSKVHALYIKLPLHSIIAGLATDYAHVCTAIFHFRIL